MKHLMIDIETLGTTADSAILSLGAVFFDPANNLLGHEFYTEISLASCQAAGMRMDASTIQWWMRQSKEAQKVFQEDQTTISDALMNFRAFVLDNANAKYVQVWGNGPSFDNAIVSSAFDRIAVKKPWNHWNERCVRTMVELGRAIGIDPKKDLPFEGEAHNALDDAKHQAKYVSVIYQALAA